MANPQTAVYPSALATYSTLPIANDTLFTSLTGAIDNSQTTGISLGLGGFNTPTLLVIDNEIILILTLSGSTVTSSIRGFAGTTATSHISGSQVFGYIVSYNNNQIIAEIVAIETALGTSLANVIQTSQTAGGDLSGTYPDPNVAHVGGASAGSVAAAVGLSHTQNTDVATSVNTVTFSATPTFNLNLGGIQTIVLTGNVTGSTVTNLRAGQVVTFIIQQDATGGRNFAWPANVHGGMNTSFATGNQVSVQSFRSFDAINLWADSNGLTMS